MRSKAHSALTVTKTHVFSSLPNREILKTCCKVGKLSAQLTAGLECLIEEENTEKNNGYVVFLWTIDGTAGKKGGGEGGPYSARCIYAAPTLEAGRHEREISNAGR